jgi:hypothetical protein
VHALSVDRLWPTRAGREQATIATTSMAERRTALISQEPYGVCSTRSRAISYLVRRRFLTRERGLSRAQRWPAPLAGQTLPVRAGEGIAVAHAPAGTLMRAAIRWFRALMNSMARWRYPRYTSRVCGTGDVVKSSNGMKNVTLEVTGSTRSCR